MKETGSLFFTVTEEAFFSSRESEFQRRETRGILKIDREFERRNEIFGIARDKRREGIYIYIYWFCKKKYHVARMASQYAFETE